jgi:hypothetical protein
VTDIDLLNLESRLRERGDTRFLSAAANPERTALLPLETLARANDIDPGRSPICYLAPAGRPPKETLEVESAVKVSVVLDQSELVELWRSYVTRTEIGYGNLRYTAQYFGFDGVLHEKDAGFVTWAKSVVASIKRELRFDKGLDAQVGRDAAERIRSGQLRVRRR